MSRVLVLFLLALICAIIAAAIGFDVVSSPHALGWVGASLAFGYGAKLVP